MKKIFNKIISSLIVAVIFATMMHYGNQIGLVTMSSALEATGQCGENVYWNFDESTGVLTITGSGDMYNYNDDDNYQSPFYGCEELKTISIADGVTSIGNEVFRVCEKLTNITIPDSVTYIGDWAFFVCEKLTNVTIPDSVTYIGDDAFCTCENLTNVTIPDNVTYIGHFAFNNCCNITSIEIPSNVENIGTNPFYGCSGLESIIVDENNEYYDSRDNCNAIINSSTNELISGCMSTKIPDTVTSIGNYAFEGCINLTYVTIPHNVTNIGSSAFSDCCILTNVSIPNSVKNIGENAFLACDRLTDIYYSGSEDEWNNIDIEQEGNEALVNATIHYNSDGIPEDIIELLNETSSDNLSNETTSDNSSSEAFVSIIIITFVMIITAIICYRIIRSSEKNSTDTKYSLVENDVLNEIDDIVPSDDESIESNNISHSDDEQIADLDDAYFSPDDILATIMAGYDDETV